MRKPPTDDIRRSMQERAELLFEQHIRAQVDESRPNDFVLIDVESGDYEVDADEMAASKRLRSRHPDALVWCRKVGSTHSRRYRSYRGSRTA